MVLYGKELDELVKRQLRSYKNKPALFFKSGRMDFEQPYIYLGRTKTGVKLGEIFSEDATNIRQFRKRVVRPKEYSGEIFFRTGSGTGTMYLTLAKAKQR